MLDNVIEAEKCCIGFLVVVVFCVVVVVFVTVTVVVVFVTVTVVVVEEELFL